MALSFFLIHGAMLWFTWTAFGLFQIASNRYMKHRWQSNMWWHRLSGSVVLFATLLYGLVGYLKLRFVKDDVHAPMGITVTALVLLIAVSGVVARSRLVRAAENQTAMLVFKYIHKIFAYVMLVVSQITIFFGIYSYTHNRDIDTVLHYVSITLFLVLWAILEAFHQHFLRQPPVKFNEPFNVMSSDEFEMEVQKGKQKLVILDDLVLDVTQFASAHPGGRFLIESNLGKDVSKFFHGGYALEPKATNNHTHSNYARTIVNSLIVARYEGKRETAIMQISARSDESTASETIKTFKFESRDGQARDQIKSFYADLDLFGKHYLVQEYDDVKGTLVGQARQYTIANTMDPATYRLYCEALNDPSTFDQQVFEDQIRKIQHAEGMNLTLKNYRVGGVSQTIHEKPGAFFSVSGPLGRSLNVDLNGLNIAFAAGTGILPFMDLVGYIARQTLNLSIDSTSPKSGFYFWLNARMGDSENIAQRLCESLAESNSGQFRYDVSIKSPNSEGIVRWTTESIQDKLTQIQQETGGKVPVNVWVCGTPSMNQTFEQAFAALQQGGKINNVTKCCVL